MNVFWDVDPDPGKAALGADASAKPAIQPRKPSPNVLPEPKFIGPSLMQPAGTLDQTLEGLQGALPFSAWAETVPEKIESFLSFSDETLIGVNGKFELSEHGMHLPYGGP